jgi:hypothetical protein
MSICANSNNELRIYHGAVERIGKFSEKVTQIETIWHRKRGEFGSEACLLLCEIAAFAYQDITNINDP